MIAYLDNSATTRPIQPAITAMTECMRDGYFNPSSLYAPAMMCEKAMDHCRAAIEKTLAVRQGRVIFTSGGTESNNLAILSTVHAMRDVKHVIVSAYEHPSVSEPAEQLKKEGIRVTSLAVDSQGQLDWAMLEQALSDAPALISVMQVNNEVGAMPDLDKLCQMVRSRAPAALIHVDGVQGFARLPINMKEIDLYTLSAHKLGGPKGVGALWTKKNVRLAPRQLGGSQELGLRAGTENTPGIAGLLAAIEHMPAGAAMRMEALRMRLLSGLRAVVPNIIVNGSESHRTAPHILNVSFPGVRGEVMLHALEGENVYCSTGSACSSKKRKLSPVLLSMGVHPDIAECALRLSLCTDTTEEEIDYACEKAGILYAALSRFRRK